MCPAVCLVVGTLVSNFSWSLLYIYLHSYCPNGFDIKDHERAKTISKDLSGRRRLLILKEIFLVWMFYLCTELTNINKYIFFYIIWWPSKSILYECLSVYLRTELKNTNNTLLHYLMSFKVNLSVYLRTELKNTNNTFLMMYATLGSLISYLGN